MRAFIAFELPNQTTEDLIDWQAVNLPPNVKPKPASELHLTLAFLGDIDEALVPALTEAIQQLDPSTVVLRGPIEYRELDRLAFLVYEEQGGMDVWEQLNQRLFDLMGYEPQFKPWLPHTTIWAYPPGEKPGINPPLPTLEFSPESISLIASTGAGYQRVASSRTSNIFDPIQETLDQQVFTGIEPKAYHLDFINRLYQRALKHELGISGDGWVDLYFTGSLTTYQYSETSDADISVFANWDRFLAELGMDAQTARKHLISLSIDHIDGTFLAGTTHPLQFFVVPQGVLPSDLYQPGLRSAYSIDDRLWYQEPEKDRVHDIASELPEFFTRASDIAEKMTEMLDHDPESARTLWHDVHKKRQLDQQAGLGDFCEGNIVYKYLLHEGLFDRIRDELGEYIAKTALDARDYEGETGNRDHITRVEKGEVPTEAIADLKGARGELPGEHRNKQDEKWAAFLDDVRENGIREPIFITVDYGEEPLISEGNHRRDAAVELGLPSVPVEIRYFGGAQPIRTSSINFEVWSDEFPPDMPEPPPGIDPMDFNNWTDEEHDAWMAYEDARHEANPSINLSNSNAMDFFRWLGLPDMDYAGTLDPHLLKQLLAEKASEPPSPVSPTIDWQGEGGGTNIDIGRPEGYMNERARQMEELADLAIARKGIISYGKVAAPTQVTPFPGEDRVWNAQFGTMWLTYSLFDNYEQMMQLKGFKYEINGPYLYPDNGGEVIYVNWAGAEETYMDIPEARDVVAMAQYLKSLGKPVYADIVNDELLQLAERKFRHFTPTLSWTEDPEDNYLIPQDVVDRAVQKMHCLHCQSHLLLDGSKPYCPNCGWKPNTRLATPPAGMVPQFHEEFKQAPADFDLMPEVTPQGYDWKVNPKTIVKLMSMQQWGMPPIQLHLLTPEMGKEWRELMGYHKYTGKIHHVYLHPFQNVNVANETLWHEIQHVYQQEENRLDMTNYDWQQRDDPSKYHEHPIEIDANEFAAYMTRESAVLPAEVKVDPAWIPRDLALDIGDWNEDSEMYELNYDQQEEHLAGQVHMFRMDHEGWKTTWMNQDQYNEYQDGLWGRSAGDTGHLWEKVNTKVIYDYERDNIILGTQALATDLPDTKIIGEYDGESVTLFEAEKQWINPDYFHRLWAHTFPNRPLHGVYYKREGGEAYKLKTRTRPKHSMAERSGDVELDSLIAEWLANENTLQYEWFRASDELGDMRDPDSAAGSCDIAAVDFRDFLTQRGLEAYTTEEYLQETHKYHGKPGWLLHPEQLGYGDADYSWTESDDQPPEELNHCATVVVRPTGVFMVDWTAAQYGYTEFPMVQRLKDKTWQREFA